MPDPDDEENDDENDDDDDDDYEEEEECYEVSDQLAAKTQVKLLFD